MSNRIRWWSLLILFLSVESVRRKGFELPIPKNVGFIQIHEVALFQSDCK